MQDNSPALISVIVIVVGLNVNGDECAVCKQLAAQSLSKCGKIELSGSTNRYTVCCITFGTKIILDLALYSTNLDLYSQCTFLKSAFN